MCSTASDLIDAAVGGRSLFDNQAAPFSIREVFDAVRDVVQPVAEHRGLDLRFQMPSADWWIGHERALHRVLLNLTTNALKFTESGYVELSAHLRRAAHVEFSVRDTGPGIDSARLGALWEPLRREQGTGRFRFSGSGLGLAVCRSLVAAMGSQLQAESQPGNGSRFYFVVELRKPNGAPRIPS